MLSVQEARSIILKQCMFSKTIQLQLPNAAGFVLAEPVFSPVNTPPFNQAAMDGFAFSFEDWDRETTLKLKGEVQAGNYLSEKINSHEAVRIFTGAPVPPGTDTVVMQEKVIVTGDTIEIKDENLCKGSNVRPQGSQSKKGELILNTGHLLTPGAVSFLAGTGINKVTVYDKPSVSIIVTGKELVKPEISLTEGKIYESNSFGLTAALKQLDIMPVSVETADDTEEAIAYAFEKSKQSDIIITTGGVSVGNYDFVAAALEKCGVKKIFHKVKQKPGKPFYFGTCDNSIVFALPGNPAAVLTCFYEYLVPAISSITKKEYFKTLKLPLVNDYTKKKELTYFLKGKITSGGVSVLDNQESYLMNSFAFADCLIELNEDKESFKAGELVTVQMII